MRRLSGNSLSCGAARGSWAATLTAYAAAVAITAAGLLAVIGQLDGPTSATESAARHAPMTASKILAGDDWTERIRGEEFWRNAGSRRSLFDFRTEGALPQLRGPAGILRAGSYRTVCVRLCDGFFFPVGYGTDASNLERDSAKCESSCSSGARLYVTRNADDTIDDMVDLRGQPYSRLKTAGLYRKAYDEACKCRPHAWEEASLNRHRIYALDVQLKKGNKSVVAELEQRKAKARQLASGAKADAVKSSVAQARAAAAERRREAAKAQPATGTSAAAVTAAAAGAPMAAAVPGPIPLPAPLTGGPIPVSAAAIALVPASEDAQARASKAHGQDDQSAHQHASAGRQGIMRLGASETQRSRKAEPGSVPRTGGEWARRAFQN